MSNQIITDKELQESRKKLQVYLLFWLSNPVAFIYDLKIANILPYQAYILQSIINNKRTLVRSGHGPGKTFIMALAAIWWLCTHWVKGQGCSVIVTSPSAGQLETVFLPQLSKCLDLLPDYFKDHFTITTEAVYEVEDKKGWRLDIRTARKENPDAMQGQHNVLFLIDEWSGVPKEIYDVIEGSQSDRGSRILGIGNPTRRSGWGYDAFHKNKKLWNCVHINCEIYTDDKEFVTEYEDIFGNVKTDTNKGLVDPKEVQKWLDICSGNRDGFEYRIRVTGDFPNAGKQQFIPLKPISQCFKQAFYEEQNKVHTLGLDPATVGTDEIALVHRWGKNLMAVKTWQEDDTQKIALQVESWLLSEGANFKFEFISIDSIGEGKGVFDKLRQLKDSGKLPNVNHVIQYKSSYEATDKERFDRLRDETWQKMKDWFIKEKPHFHEDHTKDCEKLQEELTSPSFDFTPRGKLKVESKKEMRKRGVSSPNIADAVTMTFIRRDDTAEKVSVDRYQRKLQAWAAKQPDVDWRAQ
jgi:hypothetical protein